MANCPDCGAMLFEVGSEHYCYHRPQSDARDAQIATLKQQVQALQAKMGTDLGLRVVELMSEVAERDGDIIELRQQVQALTSEVKEWLCEQCNTVYPGPPQSGVLCVICPQCSGYCGPRVTIEKRKLAEQVQPSPCGKKGHLEYHWIVEPHGSAAHCTLCRELEGKNADR